MSATQTTPLALNSDDLILVAVEEFEVLEVVALRARCLAPGCDWRSYAVESQKVAAGLAKRHGERHSADADA